MRYGDAVVRFLVLAAGLLGIVAVAEGQSLDVMRSTFGVDEVGAINVGEMSEHWGISPSEYIRSVELRRLNRGIVSDNLTPLEILGIFAETDSERRRYAELLARQQLQVLERIRAFEMDYLAAIRQNPGDAQRRARLVIDMGCSDPDCIALITEALALAPDQGLDIFLTDTGGSDSAVRAWAASHRIPPTLVRSGIITLNHAAAGMTAGLER